VSRQALVYTDDGSLRMAQTDVDWREWVSATATRNFILQDPLLDWLQIHGRENGFVPDIEQAGYDPRTDFTLFIFEKGRQFEAAVLKHIQSLFPMTVIASDRGDSRRYEKAEATFEAMVQGLPVISQAVLWDAENRTYGVADLLIRSDVLLQLFPNTTFYFDPTIPAPHLGNPNWHYRVVDIKFTTLDLTASGELGNGGSNVAYKAQLYVYNQALGRLQGYRPSVSYLLGRGWEQTLKGKTSRSDSCMDRIAPVAQGHVAKDGVSLASEVEAALSWVRRLRQGGQAWKVFPKPTTSALYPNMGNRLDGPWTKAKKQIAQAIDELTLLWYVGADKRNAAHELGITGWRDRNCIAAAVGVTGAKTQPVLQAILDINQPNEGPVIRPARITVAEEEWRPVPALEFYVDFETVSDLDDDFRNIPRKGGQPLIFMIGCGHVEEGEWRFRCFTADELTPACEAAVIDSWLGHMKAVRERLAPDDDPRIFHWSHAETSNLQTSYNAAVKRHPERAAAWSEPRWFDFLKQVMKAQPVVVHGALAFGLKAVAQALHQHGLIQTCWESGPTDGLGAMIGAWSCAREAFDKSVRLGEIPLMREIENYNEVDCRVMMEIMTFFRNNH